MSAPAQAIGASLALWLVVSGTAAGQQTAPPAADGIYRLDQAAATTKIVRSGVLQLRFSLIAGNNLPNGATLSVSVNASLNDASYSDYASQSSSSAHIQSGKANFTISVPYTFLASSANDQILISVSVSGYGTSVADQSYFSRSLPLPANGKTTVIAFSGAI